MEETVLQVRENFFYPVFIFYGEILFSRHLNKWENYSEIYPFFPPPPCRHLNLSQIVTLTVVTAGDALERTKLLHRYIEVAQLLQSQRYGNLFSFIAVMQGLAAPQVSIHVISHISHLGGSL